MTELNEEAQRLGKAREMKGNSVGDGGVRENV
jgi:hypothetical protein